MRSFSFTVALRGVETQRYKPRAGVFRFNNRKSGIGLLWNCGSRTSHGPPPSETTPTTPTVLGRPTHVILSPAVHCAVTTDLRESQVNMPSHRNGVQRRSMTPDEVWRSRCAKTGWRCSKCEATPLLSDALNFFQTGLCENCSAEGTKAGLTGKPTFEFRPAVAVRTIAIPDTEYIGRESAR